MCHRRTKKLILRRVWGEKGVNGMSKRFKYQSNLPKKEAPLTLEFVEQCKKVINGLQDDNAILKRQIESQVKAIEKLTAQETKSVDIVTVQGLLLDIERKLSFQNSLKRHSRYLSMKKINCRKINKKLYLVIFISAILGGFLGAMLFLIISIFPK